MLHTQFRHMPKALCADNGKEYVNQILRNWCNEHGIQLQSTAPYTPQQNGVAEHFNRSLVELARAMRDAKNIPISLWPTTIAHAAYL
jgi:transposase InsO family protein